MQRTHTRAGLTRASPLQCLPEFEIRRADHSENSLLRMAAHTETGSEWRSRRSRLPCRQGFRNPSEAISPQILNRTGLRVLRDRNLHPCWRHQRLLRSPWAQCSPILHRAIPGADGYERKLTKMRTHIFLTPTKVPRKPLILRRLILGCVHPRCGPKNHGLLIT